MDLLDLRSDTVTRPTPGMRKAMAEAEVGDDVYGEDPTTNRLQESVAQLLGKECAIFVPTGTMANQISLGVLCGPGDEVICERGSHVLNYEGAAASALWGAQLFPLDGTRGLFDVRALEGALRRSDDSHYPRQRAVAIENTHNRGGGAVWPLSQMQAVSQAARAAGLSVHLDGARLWNAHVATGTRLSDYGACADTVSVCLSKGLGTPAGSLVATTRARLPALHRLRKRLGGGMRQVGILAAAGLYALDNHLERLAEDHKSARRLAEELQSIRGLRCTMPETNLLFVDVDLRAGARALSEAGRAEGILFNAEGGKERIRLVTHLDVPPRTIPEAVARMRRAVDRCR
ncbi:MAG: low specificity L-threonine aldolase [Deltaproteobacteria bacterium]|nr:MAG: low specificity L-threonine aldolase [Deltaproteobacteria bacterium]